jgi:dolichol-phosphate mannosyltransferase
MRNSNSCKKIAIIPAYNNTASLVKVLDKFKDKTVDEICIVVDCPTKDGVDKIRKAAAKTRTPVHVIENEVREGVGNAIKDGIRYGLSNGYSIVVVMAGNDKDDPREIPRLLEPILRDGYDYVQGSRFLPGGRRIKNPFLRGVFSRLYPFVWTLLTNVRCTE